MDIYVTDEEPLAITCPSNHTVYNDIGGGGLFATVSLRNAYSHCDDSESATLLSAQANSWYDDKYVINLAIA